MTFQKYIGKKTIFAIITVFAVWYVHYRTGDVFDPYFPFQVIIPPFALAWIVIISVFLIRYVKKSHKARTIKQ